MPPVSLKALLREARARRAAAPGPASSVTLRDDAPAATGALPSTLIPDLQSYLSLSLASATAALAPLYPKLSAAQQAPLSTFSLLETAPSRALYARGVVSELEEQAILALMEAAPEAKWTRLSARALQVWGGTVTPQGLEQEPLPCWYVTYTRVASTALSSS